MGDEFHLGSGSWWDTTRNRSPPSASISTTLNTIASFGSAAVGGAAAAADVDGGLDDQNLQMMGLGLSSPNMDWNQALFSRTEKGETGFRSMLQDDFQQKLYSAGSSSEQLNRSVFSVDQTTPFSSQASSTDVDFHSMLLSENQSTYQNPPYQYPPAEFMPPANKYLQFSRTSRPPAAGGSPLHFTNNTPFWNASEPRSSFLPHQNQIQIHPVPSFDENSKTPEFRDSNAKKHSSNQTSSNKRPRGNETPNPVPAFKARKEKMGDRITALQQLVSPFGKTDTASVLSEAISYIKFLHEQVSVLSDPYMKNGAPNQTQQMMSADKSKDSEGPRQDLRSRGLCLVPASSTFPMTHETTVDFWTPTFGGTFR